MALGVLKKLDLSEDHLRQLYDQILALDVFKGNAWDRTSPEVVEMVMKAISADLVISKGGVNFDCLEEDLPKINTKVSFLLLSKYAPYNAFSETNLFQYVGPHK